MTCEMGWQGTHDGGDDVQGSIIDLDQVFLVVGYHPFTHRIGLVEVDVIDYSGVERSSGRVSQTAFD